MRLSIAAPSPRNRIFLGALCALIALSLRTPLDHDEGQYVAAAALVAKGLAPYRDFPFLQTPLQPFLLAPIAWMAPGWTLIASRLVNALCVATGIMLIGRTALALTRDEHAATAAMFLAAVTDCLLYAGSIARNDGLPFLLLAAALERLYAAPGRMGAGRGFLVGLLLAAAASVKISYALPAAAICAQSLWAARTTANRVPMLVLVAGSLVGALPALWIAMAAPRPFLFQVFSYNVVAVRAWAALKGESWRLSVPFRIVEWIGRMLQGPLAVMLVTAMLIRRRSSAPEGLGQQPIALGPVVAAGVLASILPMPSLRQYLVPSVAPLILWFIAVAWPERHRPGSRRVTRWLALTACTGVVGSLWVLARPDGDEAPLRVERESHLIGDIGRRSGAREIATLEPVHAVDSGLDLDPRFATGQFLFRAANVPACVNAALCPITTASIRRLDDRQPGAVLTGTQHKHPPNIPGGLDGLLDRWAASHGYRAVAVNPKNLLWLAPR